MARSAPHVSCTLVQQHLAAYPADIQALAALPPTASFDEAYHELLHKFAGDGQRIEGPKRLGGFGQLRATSQSLVLDGVADLTANVGPSMALPDFPF